VSLNLEQKQAVVAEVSKVVSDAKAAILAEYRGLTVAQMTDLRRKANKDGVYVRVVKNTLVRRAVAGSPYECLKDHLKGPLAFVAGKDPVTAAKVVVDFAKDNQAFKIMAGAMGDGSTAVVLSEYIATQFDPALSWDDVDWLRSIWAGPIVIKGVQTVADALIAVEHGVEAVALSNHGGRQLDGAPAILPLVAPVRDAVGDRIEVICDGGIRRGSDIAKAVASGATAAMAGRAYLYALGAAGERGVDRLLDWFRADLVRTMSLLGADSVPELDRSFLDHP